MKTLMIAVFLVAFSATYAQEVQVPLDEDGKIYLIDVKLEKNLRLFPEYENFDSWRSQTYRELELRRRRSLPLKTWWPKYTGEDFRLELAIGALLIQQVKWASVKKCIEGLDRYLRGNGKSFSLEGLLGIPFEKAEGLIKPCRYKTQKSKRILKFCEFVKESYGSINGFFRNREVKELGSQLKSLKIGFGEETRDCVLLYAANLPVFIADAYARRLLNVLDITQSDSYSECQAIWEEGIKRDFNHDQLDSITKEYTPEELEYALCNSPERRIPDVLLYQQFHAGIVELGISGEWDEFKRQLLENRSSRGKINSG